MLICIRQMCSHPFLRISLKSKKNIIRIKMFMVVLLTFVKELKITKKKI